MKENPYPCEKCKTCSCAVLVEYTFGMVARLPEDEQYYQCIADLENECASAE